MDLKSMTLIEMQEYMESIGEKKFRAKQVYEWFHKHLALSLDEMNNIPKKLKEKIEQTQDVYGNQSIVLYQRLMEPENICLNYMMGISLKVY